MQEYFITSCGTDIGKTFITTALCWHFRRIGGIVQAIKPVITGWNCSAPETSDTGQIIRSLGLNVTNDNIAKVSPWRFITPCAPNVAAKVEGKALRYQEIVEFCNETRKTNSDYLFIEGAGGVMSPVTENKSCIDLIRDLNISVILVVGSYLGAISHILTALEVMQNIRKVRVVLTIKHHDDCHHMDIIEYVSKYSGHDIYVQEHIGKVADCPWTATSPKIVDFILQ